MGWLLREWSTGAHRESSQAAQWHTVDPGEPRTTLIRERILRGQRETCLARNFLEDRWAKTGGDRTRATEGGDGTGVCDEEQTAREIARPGAKQRTLGVAVLARHNEGRINYPRCRRSGESSDTGRRRNGWPEPRAQPGGSPRRISLGHGDAT